MKTIIISFVVSSLIAISLTLFINEVSYDRSITSMSTSYISYPIWEKKKLKQIGTCTQVFDDPWDPSVVTTSCIVNDVLAAYHQHNIVDMKRIVPNLK